MKAAIKIFLGLLIGFFIIVIQPSSVDQEPESKLSGKDRFGAELSFCQAAMAAEIPDKCKLFGKIEIVDAFPDVKIQKVDAFADIEVQWVNAFPDSPGKWQKVDAFPDYKVQFVDAFPDYKIEIVDAFPGCD